MNQEPAAFERPKVSVILPTYNRAHLIRRAIDTVLSQTYGDFELIVVDDGSTDDTKEIVKSVQDPRLRFVQHTENRGGSAARNTGIGMARGDYIAFQDSDDEWSLDKLARQVETMERSAPEVGVVYSGFWLIHDGRTSYIPYPRISRESGRIHSELLRENFVTTPSILVKKASLLKSGLFDERLPRLQDWEIAIRLSKDHGFVCIDEPLLTSHRLSDSISADRGARIKALEMVLNKHYDEFERAGELPGHYFLLFELLFADGERGKAMGYLARGYRSPPRSMKRFMISLLLVMPLGRRIYNEVVRIAGW